MESIDVALIGEAVKQIDMAAYVLTDRAVIEALREAAARGVRVRIWRDANMAARVGDYDGEAQLGGRIQGLEIRSKSPGGELMHPTKTLTCACSPRQAPSSLLRPRINPR